MINEKFMKIICGMYQVCIVQFELFAKCHNLIKVSFRKLLETKINEFLIWSEIFATCNSTFEQSKPNRL